MSKYTTEVRFICESYAGFDMSKGYGNVNAILEDSWRKVFDFDFPIFDPEYRSVLCQKILRHYYTREIGFETVGLWKLKLQTKLQEIMPYYNKLYETETFTFNPLYDIDYLKSHEGETEGTEDVNATHTGTVGNAYSKEGNVDDTHGKDGTVNDDSTRTYQDTTWDVFSDTPQGALTNVDNNTYLTNARKVTKNGTESGSNDREYEEQSTDNRDYDESGSGTTTYNEANDSEKGFNTTMEYSEHVIGKSGGKSYASLIMEYRESLLNIDMMIIRELNELFMLVW